MNRGSDRDVVVFLTHFVNAEVERRFLKLKGECPPTCDVVLLAESGTAVPDALIPFAHFFDFSTVRAIARSILGDRIIPGNCHLRSIDFFRRFPHYRYYWFVEYDVIYSGNWSELIASFADDKSDLLASHIRTIADDPDWHWREAFSTGPGRREKMLRQSAALPLSSCISASPSPAPGTVPIFSQPIRDDRFLIAFLPVHRISARGLEAVARKVKEGWVGHFEALVPSALADCGLRVADLGGSGPWTPKHRVLRNYLDWPGYHGAGTLRYRPPVKWLVIKNMLYHPCKTRETPLAEVTLDSTPGNADPERRNFRMLIPYWLKVIQLAVLSRVRRT